MVILCSMSTHRALGFEKAPGIRSLGSRLYICTFRSLADSLAGKLEPIRLDESDLERPVANPCPGDVLPDAIDEREAHR
jgi:hypothetical protein